jgi:hypothetical protein
MRRRAPYAGAIRSNVATHINVRRLMSVRASFTAVDQSLWEHVNRRLSAARADDVTCFYPPNDLWASSSPQLLEGGLSSWAELHSAFWPLGKPLLWVFSGDLAPFGGLRPLSAGLAFPGDHYLAYLHRDRVPEVLNSLRTYFAAHSSPQGAIESIVLADLAATISAYEAASSLRQALFIQVA